MSDQQEQERPLFVPLKAEYYRDFENGTKTTEYRLYGARWNEKTCRPGRAVTLSLGYGKRERIHGVVSEFVSDPLGCLPSYVGRELRALFGDKVDTLTRIACIGIRLDDDEAGWVDEDEEDGGCCWGR